MWIKTWRNYYELKINCIAIGKELKQIIWWTEGQSNIEILAAQTKKQQQQRTRKRKKTSTKTKIIMEIGQKQAKVFPFIIWTLCSLVLNSRFLFQLIFYIIKWSLKNVRRDIFRCIWCIQRRKINVRMKEHTHSSFFKFSGNCLNTTKQIPLAFDS